MNSDLDNLWQNTVGYGATGKGETYLTAAQNCRLERIRCCRMLYRGQHRQYFLNEARTAFDFPEIRVQGLPRRLYSRFNVLRLVTLKGVDLLLGEQPALKVDEAMQQQDVDALVKRSNLHRRFFRAAKEASWAGEGFVQVIRWNSEAYLVNLSPDEIFPVGEIQPDGQHAAYVRYATATISIDGQAMPLLLQTIYEPGVIRRTLTKLKEDGTVGEVMPMALWPGAGGQGGLAEEEPTGLTRNSIIWMANEDEEGIPVSDYDGLIEPQDRLNAKITQIARVLAKHSDPKLAAPEAAADEAGNSRGDHDVYFYRNKEEIPSYIVWNAELASAMQDRDFALADLCIEAEMSPVLLGLPGTSVPDTARGLRLRATNALSRAKRKAANLQPFIERAIDVARELDGQQRLSTVALTPVGVEMRDGLPVDEIDQANALATLKGAGLLSLERGVGIQIPDPEAAAKEVALIQQQAAAATPSILMQEPGSSDSKIELPATPGITQDNTQGAP